LHEPLIERLDGPFDEARRIPGLALSGRPSADPTVWRLRLRPGVRFQDGARFNASAVLANADRWLATPVGRGLLGDLLVDAPRPDLVRFILPSPDPHFDRRLASPRLGIVSPEAIAQAGDGPLDPGRYPDSGTGPFELRERSADRLLLARNTEWWGAERGLGPGIDQLELLAVPDPAERLAMLRDGSARVAYLEPSQLEAARRDPLLTAIPERGRDGLGIERSVRGIPPRQPAPPLNGAWITGIDAG
jgi:peptide/nickel transport system substrate-binding protein